MGYRHSKDEILEGAVAAALDDGLSQLTFGRLAKRLGINDRTIVYYFPTKDDLTTEVVMAVGVQLQQMLGDAFSTPAADHLELARAAWPVLARREADPIFALFFEANGLAAARREPYDTLVPQLIEAWITWVMTFLTGTVARRRAEAEAAIALIDGLLLLRQLGGSAAAARAARRLGVTPYARAGPPTRCASRRSPGRSRAAGSRCALEDRVVQAFGVPMVRAVLRRDVHQGRTDRPCWLVVPRPDRSQGETRDSDPERRRIVRFATMELLAARDAPLVDGFVPYQPGSCSYLRGLLRQRVARTCRPALTWRQRSTTSGSHQFAQQPPSLPAR